MKRNIEEIINHLEALKADRDEKQSKLRKEYSEAQNKAREIDEALKVADDPDDYKRLLKEKSENDQFLSFLNSRKPNGFKPAISDAEYRSITRDIDSEIEELQKAYAPKIEKEIAKLVSILDEYSDEAEELEEVKHKASFLFNNSRNTVWKANNLSKLDVDPLFYFNHICQAYFNQRSTIVRLKNAVKRDKTFKANVWFNSEEASIFKELVRRAG